VGDVLRKAFPSLRVDLDIQPNAGANTWTWRVNLAFWVEMNGGQEHLVGFFEAFVPDIAEDPRLTYGAWLDAVRQLCAQARTHAKLWARDETLCSHEALVGRRVRVLR
jgi:hypothetical protein